MRLFIISFLFSGVLFGKVEVINQNNTKIFLKGPSCQRLRVTENALREWNFDSKKFGEPNKCKCTKVSCSLDITPVVPKHILYLEGKHPNFAGPNCFNTALNDQRILKERRASTVDEINFWRNSPLCKQIKKGEEISPGDLYIVFDDSGLPLHGFTYISDDIVFSKGGPGREIKYKLDEFDWMFRTYKVPKECYHVNEVGKCPRYGLAYSCESLQSYRLKNPMKNKRIQEVLNELDAIAMTVEQLLLSEDSSTFLDSQSLNKKLQKMRVPIIEEKGNPKYNSIEKFYWKIIWFKFIGLDRQIRDMI